MSLPAAAVRGRTAGFREAGRTGKGRRAGPVRGGRRCGRARERRWESAECAGASGRRRRGQRARMLRRARAQPASASARAGSRSRSRSDGSTFRSARSGRSARSPARAADPGGPAPAPARPRPGRSGRSRGRAAAAPGCAASHGARPAREPPRPRVAATRAACRQLTLMPPMPRQPRASRACPTSRPAIVRAALATLTYEMILMLDPETGDEQRDKIAADVKSKLDSRGRDPARGNWGMRKMAYQIEKHESSDYRFFRFNGEQDPARRPRPLAQDHRRRPALPDLQVRA